MGGGAGWRRKMMENEVKEVEVEWITAEEASEILGVKTRSVLDICRAYGFLTKKSLVASRYRRFYDKKGVELAKLRREVESPKAVPPGREHPWKATFDESVHAKQMGPKERLKIVREAHKRVLNKQYLSVKK